jgi:hypothetical protein
MARRRPDWLDHAPDGAKPPPAELPKNLAIPRNCLPLQAIDFMPFLTHLYESAELVALNGGLACASIGRRAF